jgi:TatD DNase family protein
MIDAHCHLIDNLYGKTTPEELINNAKQAGVNRLICNGAGLRSSQQAIEIAEKFTEVYATVGIHPEEAEELQQLGEKELKKNLWELAKRDKVVAIGEAGLDFFADTSEVEKEFQKGIFKINLWLAEETGLPLVIHNRNADLEIEELVGDKYRGMLHCFVQGEEYMKRMIKNGFYISFGGILTFKKSQQLRELAETVPENRLLIETDAPYLAPEPVRGSINTPVNVTIVADTLATIRKLSTDKIDMITTANALNLFSKIK